MRGVAVAIDVRAIGVSNIRVRSIRRYIAVRVTMAVGVRGPGITVRVAVVRVIRVGGVAVPVRMGIGVRIDVRHVGMCDVRMRSFSRDIAVRVGMRVAVRQAGVAVCVAVVRVIDVP